MSERATAVALEIAERLYEQPRVFSVRGLAGTSGAALLFAAAASATGDERYRHALHESLVQAASADTPGHGLFIGIAGVYGAAAYAARTCDERYASLAAKCEHALQQLAQPVRPPFGVPPRTDLFDVISGWSGTLLALSEKSGTAWLQKPRSFLAWLAGDAQAVRWRCVHPLEPDGPPRNDVGLAHGLPGILAALSFNTDRDPHSLQAARTAADWIVEHRMPQGPLRWPSFIDSTRVAPSRIAWCYGTPGIATALYAAGRYLGDTTYSSIAVRAMREAAAHDFAHWQMTDHALCHGSAGNALAFASIGLAENDPLLLSTARALRDRIIAHYESNTSAPSGDHLEGDSGIALALLTLSGKCDPSWMTLHAMEPLRAAL